MELCSTSEAHCGRLLQRDCSQGRPHLRGILCSELARGCCRALLLQSRCGSARSPMRTCLRQLELRTGWRSHLRCRRPFGAQLGAPRFPGHRLSSGRSRASGLHRRLPAAQRGGSSADRSRLLLMWRLPGCPLRDALSSGVQPLRRPDAARMPRPVWRRGPPDLRALPLALTWPWWRPRLDHGAMLLGRKPCCRGERVFGSKLLHLRGVETPGAGLV